MILQTGRLILRNFKDDDFNSFYKYRNDANCAKYQWWKNTSKDYLKTFIEEEKLKILKPDGSMQLAIALKNIDELIGDVYISFKNNTITLGYTIATEYQRKGYAYEMIQALIAYLFKNFQGYEIVCMVHSDNNASKGLLEKLKFKEEGYLKKMESIIYSLNSLV